MKVSHDNAKLQKPQLELELELETAAGTGVEAGPN